MKTKYIIFLTIALILCISSCEIDTKLIDSDKQVEAIIGETFTTKNADNTWEIGDEAGIFMIKAGEKLSAGSIVENADNRKYVNLTGDSAFVPFSQEETIYFPTNGDKVDFVAYFPYKESLSNYTYPINTIDQSNQKQLDLLYSTNVINKDKTQPKVSLVFQHRLSNFVFEISPAGELTQEDLEGLQITLSGFHTTADFSLSENKILNYGNKTNMQAKVNDQGTYGEAIVLPTSSELSSQTDRSIKFKLSNYKELTYYVPNDSLYLEETQYIFEVKLTNTSVEVNISGINPWIKFIENNLTLYDEEALLTPNCYIVPPNSSERIPVYKLFVAWQTQPVLSAAKPDLSGELTCQLIWEDYKGLITSTAIEGSNPFADLVVHTGAQEGNAVIGVYVSGKLRWSWHIWVTNYNPNITNGNYIYTTSYRSTTFMDRNLGALSKEIGNLKSYGLYYQWGRKDPFPGPTTINAGDTDVHIPLYGPNNSSPKIIREKVSNNQNIPVSMENPLTFYYVTPYATPSNGREEWYSANENIKHNFLWSTPIGTKGIFDPCPEGWKVPWGTSNSTYASPWYLAGANTSSGGGGDYKGTWNYGYDFNDPIYKHGYYPAAGAIKSEDGKFREVGSVGYWPSSRYGLTQIYLLRIANNYVNTWQMVSRRSYGFSVRCVKE